MTMFNSEKINLLDNKVRVLEAENRSLRAENQLLAELGNGSSSLHQGIECFGVDFDLLAPFSIERNLTQIDIFGKQVIIERTEIGYFLNNEVKSWFLYTTKEAHVELVRQFEQYLKKHESAPNQVL